MKNSISQGEFLESRKLLYKEEVIKGNSRLLYSLSSSGGFKAWVIERNGKEIVVKDGAEVGGYDKVHRILFSPNGNSFACAAERDGKWVVVKDGDVLGEYDQVFSLRRLKSGSFVYGVEKDGKWRLMKDRDVLGEYDKVHFIITSSDRNSFACVAERNGKDVVLKDGVEWRGKYDYVHDLIYPKKGTTLACVARRGPKWFVVVDGIEGKGYDKVLISKWSSDGRSLIYGAEINGETFIVELTFDQSQENLNDQKSEVNSDSSLKKKLSEIKTSTSSAIKDLISGVKDK